MTAKKTNHDRCTMPLVPMLEVLAKWRTDEVIISSMSAAREWIKFPEHPLDLIYLPSAMGQPTSLGLGIALSQPQRHIIVLVGDGSLLLNLSSLVTIAAAQPKNLTLILLENGVYEVTGSQKTAAAQIGTSFPRLALAAGFKSVVSLSDLDVWQSQISATMQMDGPRFINLKIEPTLEDPHLPVPTEITARLSRLQRTLGIGSR